MDFLQGILDNSQYAFITAFVLGLMTAISPCPLATNISAIGFISRDIEKRVIADAKYKPIDNIGNRDYLQVLAYMFRFDAKEGFYLYPEANDSDDLMLQMNRGSTYEKNVEPRDDIRVTKHGLKIPGDAVSYEDFVSKIKNCEHDFIHAMKKDDDKVAEAIG